jgi:hypothetical protein
MVVLADSAVWVGVVGTAVGGLIAILGSGLVHRWARAERLRAERKDAYAAFLAKAEDSLHLFQWLAEGHFEDGWKEDGARANRFYDQEVTPRLMVLKMTGAPGVVEAASEFKNWHASYRAARDNFIRLARADLERGEPRRRLNAYLRART